MQNPFDRSKAPLKLCNPFLEATAPPWELHKDVTCKPGVACRRGERQTTELVAGTTRWRRRLNYIIDQVSRQPHDKLEVPLLVVLQVR